MLIHLKPISFLFLFCSLLFFVVVFLFLFVWFFFGGGWEYKCSANLISERFIFETIAWRTGLILKDYILWYHSWHLHSKTSSSIVKIVIFSEYHSQIKVYFNFADIISTTEPIALSLVSKQFTSIVDSPGWSWILVDNWSYMYMKIWYWKKN